MLQIKEKKDWKINQSDKCDFCSDTDTVVHYFWECGFTKEIITKCLSVLKLSGLDVDKWDFVIGKNEKAFDNICGIVKYYIYQIRSNRSTFNEDIFLREIAIRWISDYDVTNDKALQEKWSIIQHINLEELAKPIKY